MTNTDPVHQLMDAGLIAILRAPSSRHLLAIADVLLDAGIHALEITLTPPDAVPALAEIARRAPQALVGAGTVLTTDQAQACIDAGARFLVSPAASPEVMGTARAAGIAALPGALTPTEILAAHQAGATAVKLFPAAVVGPRFVRELHGPFPQISFIPSGGVGIDDIPDWFAAGAAAVGLGGALLGTAADDGPDPSLAQRARRAVAAVIHARQQP